MKTVAAVVIGLAIVFLLVYNSAVGRTVLDEAWDDYRHWTAANIEKYPERYFAFCERKGEETIKTLNTAEDRIRKASSNLTERKNESDKVIAQGEKFLDDMAEIYNNPDKQWPVMWLGRPLNELEFEEQGMRYTQDIERRKRFSELYGKYLPQLDTHMRDIQDKKRQNQDYLEEVRAKRVIFVLDKEIRNLVSELAGINVNMENLDKTLLPNLVNPVDITVRSLDEDIKLLNSSPVPPNPDIFRELMASRKKN